jgi:hypothetical protein
MTSFSLKLPAFLFSCWLGLMPGISAAEDPLAEGFANPPKETAPWCFYYWISDRISKEGITRDLEAMARVGIGEALIGNIFLDEVKPGNIKVLSEEWWQLIEHAIREGGRLGVDIGLFNCPGWSQSGGPWIDDTQTMRRIAWSETRASGPGRFTGKLPQPEKVFQDVAPLAFPAPQLDTDALAAKSPRVTTRPAAGDAPNLTDGRLDTKLLFPEGAGMNGTEFVINIELGKATEARTLQVSPADDPFSATCIFQAEVDGRFVEIRRFSCDWSFQSRAVGFIPQAPVTISFPPVTSRRFRLIFTDVAHGHRNFVPSDTASLAEINLTGSARLEKFIEKQLGKMLPIPTQKWDSYLWPQPSEPDAANLVVPREGVIDLSGKLAADGTLDWEMPPGEWVILRAGMTPTGMENSPASPEGRGPEVDKMKRRLAKHHIDSFIGELCRRMPAEDRRAFKRVVVDSYEMGAQNWTDDFAEAFEKSHGYDPKPWLPVLTGRIVGSADQSERFLWDMRRLVADRVASEYVGGLREAAAERGLGLWLQNYGHWGYPGESLLYGSQSDRVSGEFWVTGDLGSTECRAASSCANLYGKKFVSAESYTGGPPFQSTPRSLKARGDWSFCEGVNHVVLHVYIQQPDEKAPGVNAPWGTEFNRHNTWFERSKPWIDYQKRACWLLQQGCRVADVAYFIGEDAPKMTGVHNPPLPPGHDFDHINSDAIMNRLTVKDGVLTLPHGTIYQVLVLPELDTMRPELLRRIGELVSEGATVVGSAPSRSPSMRGFPHSDEEVRKLAEEIWGGVTSGIREYGKGRIFVNMPLEEVFAKTTLAPDFISETPLRFTHRRDGETDIYFIANPKDEKVSTTATFRAAGREPELWWPLDGRIEQVAQWQNKGAVVELPLELGPHGSVCVVFRKATAEPSASVPRDASHAPELQPFNIAGPWDVSFTPGMGAPDQATFEVLADLSQHEDPGIRNYSGKTFYRTSFTMENTAAAARLVLDLGEVRDLATVKVNGREFTTLWLPPWRVDITDAVKPGENALEIEIINPWNNRLAGDASLPADRRKTSLALATVTEHAPLMPAGLLGPVRVVFENK